MNTRTPTPDEKIEMYERLLHQIQANAEIIMDEKKVRKLIGNVCNWSYAHRQGNGELPDAEQQALINKAFWKLTKL